MDQGKKFAVAAVVAVMLVAGIGIYGYVTPSSAFVDYSLNEPEETGQDVTVFSDNGESVIIGLPRLVDGINMTNNIGFATGDVFIMDGGWAEKQDGKVLNEFVSESIDGGKSVILVSEDYSLLDGKARAMGYSSFADGCQIHGLRSWDGAPSMYSVGGYDSIADAMVPAMKWADLGKYDMLRLSGTCGGDRSGAVSSFTYNFDDAGIINSSVVIDEGDTYSLAINGVKNTVRDYKVHYCIETGSYGGFVRDAGVESDCPDGDSVNVATYNLYPDDDELRWDPDTSRYTTHDHSNFVTNTVGVSYVSDSHIASGGKPSAFESYFIITAYEEGICDLSQDFTAEFGTEYMFGNTARDYRDYSVSAPMTAVLSL